MGLKIRYRVAAITGVWGVFAISVYLFDLTREIFVSLGATSVGTACQQIWVLCRH